jgi:hypothetical protein
MDMLAYWKWENYVRDLDEGAGFNFNSNQERLHSALKPGERLWLVSGRRRQGGIQYLLLGCLQVVAKTFNPPGYKYGKYRVWGDIQHSAYFTANGPDLSDLLLKFEFRPRNPVAARAVIGQSLQTMRCLATTDVNLLLAWAKGLSLERRAYQVVDEVNLERAYEVSEDAVREAVAEYHVGVSEARKLTLQREYSRNRGLVEQLHNLYNGRCQLCGFDPELVYGVRACCGHHIVYLSRGGRDELENMMLVCPNHHEVIHAAGSVFDFKDLHYLFPKNRREPLVLNRHLPPSVLPTREGENGNGSPHAVVREL